MGRLRPSTGFQVTVGTPSLYLSPDGGEIVDSRVRGNDEWGAGMADGDEGMTGGAASPFDRLRANGVRIVGVHCA